MSKTDFEKLLVEAIDEGLSALGDSSKQAIYYHLEESFRIKKNEIPVRVEAFATAIEKLFGLGANFLEIIIMKRLHEKTGQNIEWQGSKNLTFVEYVDVVKQSFPQSKGKNTEITFDANE